jgi:dCMP deaminase
MNNDKWDERWMERARHIGSWSKDPNTQVGCVIVRERRIVTEGYNGFPQHTSDDMGIYDNRVEKYARVVHAEANAIAGAARFGISVRGSSAYVTFPICCHCAGLLVNSGVVRVVLPLQSTYDAVRHENLRWDVSQELFAEAGLIVDYVC